MPSHRVAFLTVTGLGGAALAAVQCFAVVLALFSGPVAIASVICLTAVPAVAALAAIGTAGRPYVPFLRTRPGLWVWGATVYTGGGAGTLGLLALSHGPGVGPPLPGLFGGSAVCFALTAAYFLPGVRTRLAVLAATAVFAAGTGTAAWAAARPPTPAEWLAGHHVDRGLLRLGATPAGYAGFGLGATSGEFTVTYDRQGGSGEALRLTVRRISYETERTAANGCPVPFGRRTVCAGDGEGRQRVRYAEPDASGVAVTPDGVVPQDGIDELRLRRSGLVYVVSYDGGGAFDLASARHVLATLRPATAADLAALPRTP